MSSGKGSNRRGQDKKSIKAYAKNYSRIRWGKRESKTKSKKDK